MIDRDERTTDGSGLSAAGLRRREAMLGELKGAMAARSRRRRGVRAAAWSASAAGAAAVVWVAIWVAGAPLGGGHAPRGNQPLLAGQKSPPPPLPALSAGPSGPAQPAMVSRVAIVEDRKGIVERLSSRTDRETAGGAQMISDEQLISLAEAQGRGERFGIVVVEGKARLVANR